MKPKHLLLSTLFLATMLIMLAPAAIAVTTPAAAATGIIYVDKDAAGTPDGTSWTNAYLTVQDALVPAVSGAEIWVAEGVYYPDEGFGRPPNDRRNFFPLKSGVAVYGGFAGTEMARDERSPDRNLTVLSGDIDDNDSPKFNGCAVKVSAIAGANSYNVVGSSGTDDTAVLDGFTICNGSADTEGAEYSVRGGGIWNVGSPTLRNLHILANFALYHGGGMWSRGNPSFTNVDFHANSTGVDPAINNGIHHGGGLRSEGNPTLTKVLFRNNLSSIGGGMFANNSPTLNQVSFRNNEAYERGGGLFTEEGILNDVIFEENIALFGGGHDHPCCYGGGGMMTKGASKLTNVLFVANEARDLVNLKEAGFGGGLLVIAEDGVKVELTNVVFRGNWAEDDGGGLAVLQGGFTGTNLTFAGNLGDHGDALRFMGVKTSAEIHNSIFWGHATDGAISAFQFLPLTIYDSLVQDCTPGWTTSIGYTPCGTDGGNNKPPADPQFVLPVNHDAAPTTVGNVRLLTTSPALDVGNNSAIPVGVTTDLDGRPRIHNATVDLGAYELPVRCDTSGATLLRVDKDATGSNTGLDWDNALPTLQDALFMADPALCPGNGVNEIWVAEGNYYTDEGPYGPGTLSDLRYHSHTIPKDDMKILGGFKGDETDPFDRDPNLANHITTLSGDLERNDWNASGLTLSSDDIVGYNSFHVVVSNRIRTEMDRFTITGGDATIESTDAGNEAHFGGGFFGQGGSAELRDLNFTGNRARQGGGAFLEDNTVVMTGGQFVENSAVGGIDGLPGNGGGLYADGLDLHGTSVKGASFLDNHANNFGGGMFCKNNLCIVNDTKFLENTAVSGGGLYCINANPRLTDVDFRKNKVSGGVTTLENKGGGGMQNVNSDAALLNVRFLGNEVTGSAYFGGGGMLNVDSAPTLTNALFSGNVTSGFGGSMANEDANPHLINVTMSGNQASRDGGGIYNGTDSTSTIENTIIWNNQDRTGTGTPSSSLYNLDSPASITNSDIQHCSGTASWKIACGTDNGNNIDEDPRFILPVDPANAPTTDGNLHLHTGSPAIDTGENSLNSEATDLEGDPRKTDGDGNGSVNIDMGAYEAPTVESGRILFGLVTNPASDPQEFTFNLSGGPVPIDIDFILAHDYPVYFSGALLPGTYSLTEQVPGGWELSEAICQRFEPAPNALMNTIDPKNFELGEGDVVVCEFTNTKLATILMRKETQPDGSPEAFDYTIQGPETNKSGSLKDGEFAGAINVSSGSWELAETINSAGWDLTTISCISQLGSAWTLELDALKVNVELAVGDTVECVFNNVQQGKIRVDKVTTPSDDPQIFNFNLSGGPDNIDQSFALADADPIHDSGMVRTGTYTLTETKLAGWLTEDIDCGPALGGSIFNENLVDQRVTVLLSPGDDVLCTFTNVWYDAGDLPDPFPTLVSLNGPRHGIGSDLYLGACVDSEQDGQPNATATGDDTQVGGLTYGACAVNGDDEDGVTQTTPLRLGDTAIVTVMAHNTSGVAAQLQGWADWNGNQAFDPGEELMTGDFAGGGAAIPAGPATSQDLTFTVPADAAFTAPGLTAMRFRLSSAGGLDTTGPSPDGEVEDYFFVHLPCSAPNAPVISITQVETQVQLAWPSVTDSIAYIVYRSSNTPYFTPASPAYATTFSNSWLDPDTTSIGDVADNYFYIVRAASLCGLSADSNRVGEFDFQLLPGTP